MNKDDLALLKKTRELIDTKDKWCQGRMDVDINSIVIARCLFGALFEAEEICKINYYGAKEQLNKIIGGSITDFNDTHTYEEVIAKVDEAIEKMERELADK